MPLATSTSLTRAASGEPGRMPRRSGPMIAWISRRAPSASAGLPRVRSSITRSSRLATNVTPLALTACRSHGARSHGFAGSRAPSTLLATMSSIGAERRRRPHRGAHVRGPGDVQELADRRIGRASDRRPRRRARPIDGWAAAPRGPTRGRPARHGRPRASTPEPTTSGVMAWRFSSPGPLRAAGVGNLMDPTGDGAHLARRGEPDGDRRDDAHADGDRRRARGSCRSRRTARRSTTVRRRRRAMEARLSAPKIEP